VATPLATALLLVLGWRQIFFVVTVASVVMGLIYFFFRDYGCEIARVLDGLDSSRASQVTGSAEEPQHGAHRSRVHGRRCRRDGGVNQIYFAPPLANDFGYSN